MDKWLEELKRNKEDDLKIAEYAGVTLTSEEYKRLIQQAERVQELEKDNKRLKDLNSNNLPVMRSMHEETERYKQALEIYADENMYVTDIAGMEIEPTVMMDKGAVALQALKGVEG
ncbi:hypothetical protein [Virgibacillus salexigens]|uniref:hypothetical protein n=1 Tax=Virgibacillus TaxID=84406 RepID=UPI001368830B|nr:hypothetical protein [Virgibacillus massiliensis]MYL41800.1 hypothetical protein [Virgibacillus massiliensis]